jgi:hypothetical protein
MYLGSSSHDLTKRKTYVACLLEPCRQQKTEKMGLNSRKKSDVKKEKRIGRKLDKENDTKIK